MKFVMIRPSYTPEISGGNHLAMDLVEDAAKSGDEVVLIVPFPERVSDEVKREFEGKIDEVQFAGKVAIHRVRSRFGEGGFAVRALRMGDLSLRMMARALSEKDADALISHSMPVFLGPLSALAGKLTGIPVVYWEQDIVSNSIHSTQLFQSSLKSKALYAVARGMERFTSRLSSHVITISRDFVRRQVEEFGKAADRVSLLHNWIDVNQVHPVPREENFLFDKCGLSRSDFIVTYCGTLGLPQNVEILVDAARALQKYPDIKVVIFGGGVREKAVRRYIEEAALPNVSIFPLEPLENAAQVYSLGDVGLVIGRKGTSGNGFPSKTWSILAAGQALITCFDERSELEEIVREEGCGISVPPNNPDALAGAIERLYLDRELLRQCADNAREAAVERHSRAAATEFFWRTVKQAVERRAS